MSYKLRFICMKVIALGCFLLIFQAGFSQMDFGGVDQLLERNKKALGNNIVALIYKDGKLIYQKQIGEDFTAKVQTPIGASSQWLTAALVMTFVDQGKIKLDDPVSKYIPVFTKYMKSYVTIRQCLSGTTGIEKDNNLRRFVDSRKFESLEAEVNAIAAKEISNNPGMEFFYGPTGFHIVARVCEIVGKKAFERLVQERVTRPLKMKGTNFTNDNGGASNPSGGAVSTANDFINFLSMFLNNGMFEGKRILSEASIAEMQKKSTGELPVKFSPAITKGYEYGLGEWIVERDNAGNATVVTSPGIFGMSAYYDKCRNYAAVVFVKSILAEQKKDFGLELKAEADEVVGGCK